VAPSAKLLSPASLIRPSFQLLPARVLDADCYLFFAKQKSVSSIFSKSNKLKIHNFAQGTNHPKC
jgi:hypothetical protein